MLLRGALARTQSLTARLYEAWRADQFVVLVPEPILAEVDAVTARPELWRKLGVTPREARAVPRRLRRHAVLVQPDVTIPTSRDPRNDKFLECAVSGGADYVVSADADLLSLREVRGHQPDEGHHRPGRLRLHLRGAGRGPPDRQGARRHESGSSPTPARPRGSILRSPFSWKRE